MRVSGTFSSIEQLGRPKQRGQTHRLPRERVDSSLLAIDHAHRVAALETGRPERVHGGERGAARGDDVLDEADALTGVEEPLEAVRRAVALRLLAHDQER